MNELIKREDAIEAMYELQGIAQSKAELTGISKAWKRIKVLPTVDAVQVVRCKECKHFDGDQCCDKIGILVIDAELFYCADGERKENRND